MGKDSKIEWTHHTFNCWRGCTKISPGCKFCYAEKLAGRNPAVLGEWGREGTRVIASDAVWRQPLLWDRKAWEAGERHRVFCASLADVFEGPETMPAESWEPVQGARKRLADLIRQTPNLDWLLLTKRPENAARMLAEMFGPDRSIWPRNFRVGTSVEDQEAANTRLPHLMRLDWPNFVSVEPLLETINFRPHIGYGNYKGNVPGHCVDIDGCTWHRPGDKCTLCGWGFPDDPDQPGRVKGVDWIIVGGESGPNARPMNPLWVRSIRDQCLAAQVPFLFKQWGEWVSIHEKVAGQFALTIDRDEIRYGEWHRDDDQFHPDCICGVGYGTVVRVGKKAAGRHLDGVIHDEFPEPQGVARG